MKIVIQSNKIIKRQQPLFRGYFHPTAQHLEPDEHGGYTESKQDVTPSQDLAFRLSMAFDKHFPKHIKGDLKTNVNDWLGCNTDKVHLWYENSERKLGEPLVISQRFLERVYEPKGTGKSRVRAHPSRKANNRQFIENVLSVASDMEEEGRFYSKYGKKFNEVAIEGELAEEKLYSDLGGRKTFFKELPQHQYLWVDIMKYGSFKIRSRKDKEHYTLQAVELAVRLKKIHPELKKHPIYNRHVVFRMFKGDIPPFLGESSNPEFKKRIIQSASELLEEGRIVYPPPGLTKDWKKV